VHTFKYGGRPQLAAALARPLAAAVLRAGPALNALAWIPLHPVRERERGFNQSERLARVLARSLGIPLRGGLRRLRATAPQVGLSEAERRANLAGAFAWEGSAPPPGLGLVDDVLTTGATLQAAEAAVEAAGGQVGVVLVLAVRGGVRAALPQTFPAPAVTHREGRLRPP
jgi:ComF family protein